MQPHEQRRPLVEKRALSRRGGFPQAAGAADPVPGGSAGVVRLGRGFRPDGRVRRKVEHRRASALTACRQYALHAVARDERAALADRCVPLSPERAIDDYAAEIVRPEVAATRRRGARGPDNVIAVRLGKAEMLEGMRQAGQMVAIKSEQRIASALLQP